jgi:uncharacterized membrane protein YbhN (UPF0104 family)
MKRSTSKKIVTFCLINGVLWVWCSYFLAYLGRYEIAEDLSKVAVTQIIAVVLIYCLKSLFENLAKNNDWLDKTDATSTKKKYRHGQDCD